MAVRLTPVGAIVGASVAGGFGAVALARPSVLAEVLLGMAGPLVVAVASWELTQQTYRRRPERLTRLMVAAFAGKLVFFGAYVTVMLAGASLEPLPFVVSFTASFIGLLVVEALCLRRLFLEPASR
jgi:hypothetical protein